MAFFQDYWEVIGKILQIVSNELFETTCMLMPMATRVIYMIPKGNRQSMDVSKRGPITLLNTIYKVDAKALRIRF